MSRERVLTAAMMDQPTLLCARRAPLINLRLAALPVLTALSNFDLKRVLTRVGLVVHVQRLQDERERFLEKER